MIIPESNGILVLELFYNFLKITMETFLELMIRDSSPSGCSSKTPPNENEITSPTSYLFYSNSRKLYHRKSLQFDTIVEATENQLDLDVSSIDSAQGENKSNSSFNKDFEELKIYMIHGKTVHSSPKLVTAHFEDSGFLNYSSEMTSGLETISEVRSPREDKSLGHDFSNDSYLQEDKDHLDSWLKMNENLYTNGSFIAKPGDLNTEKYSEKYFLGGSNCKSLDDQFIAGSMNAHDSDIATEMRPTDSQSSAISNACEYGTITEEFANMTSKN